MPGTQKLKRLLAALGATSRCGSSGRRSSGRNRIWSRMYARLRGLAASLSSWRRRGGGSCGNLDTAEMNPVPMRASPSRPELTTRPSCGDPGAPKGGADWLEMIWERQATTPDSGASSGRKRDAAARGAGTPLRLVWSRSPESATAPRPAAMLRTYENGGA